MSIETEIQSEVETLRNRFPETKALYREVCALLFFRYGITPTANKLYQFVRKGSMSAPSEALNKFWEELRSKARVEIDHPDLPAELKATAAEAIAAIWQQATALARHELAELRVEVNADLERAKAELTQANATVAKYVDKVLDLDRQLGVAHDANRGLTVELESERRAHTGSAARLQEVQRVVEDLRSQQERQRAGFSADLAKAREAVDQANTRADAGERRALLEIDQERQARAKAEKLAESLRTQLSGIESHHRDVDREVAESISRLQAQLESATSARAEIDETLHIKSTEVEQLRRQLADAERETLLARSEAQTVRSVLDRLAPASSDGAHALPTNRAAREGKRKP